ncbi:MULTISPECIES: hypothetical protein [unclassified Rhodococcus (in: high G+C Gram-positive bacteria)]|uniref:hypothetical protein n=1 Tax=unclassified Rhodococcus (in: high G+C Gram-positive bacteria) TaxID=192944 RepID=UPI0002D29285|nr:hypothetical protein [Rhodococcus sp. DK17]
MIKSDSLRGEVAAQLAGMSASGGPLDTKSPTNTNIRYAASLSHRSFRKNVVEQYRSRETPPREARSAVLTAGAPGAGKSTLLREHVAELYDYRPLDADVVKDFLIEQAPTDGIYDDLLDTVPADGARLAPRELAALVHDEIHRPHRPDS